MVHPAAVADTLLRWAAGSGYTGGGKPADPAAVALLLRTACALWRASPNDAVRARQLEHVQALAALLRSLSNLDKTGTRDHWGPASAAQRPGAGEWSAECTWSASNTLFSRKPTPHGGTAATTASAGHALLDAHEVLVAVGDLGTSAAVRAAAESAAEWIVEECGHVGTAAGPVFRWAPGMAHRVPHASAAAAGFLARAALTLSRDAWLNLAVAAVPALQQSKGNGKDSSAFPLAAEDSSVDAAYHASVCESLAVIHLASGSAGAEQLLRRGGACLRLELFKLQPNNSGTAPLNAVLQPLGAQAQAACIVAAMNIFKQIEDADGDEALVLAKSVSEWMTSPASGMRAVDASGAFLSETGEALPIGTQAACAYAFALLLEAPEHKQATVGLSGGSNGGGSSTGSSLSDLLMSILEPGVSTATHVVMQVSLVIMFVVLGTMIAVIGPNVHLIVMFSLGVGLVLSYMWFMAALADMGEEQPAAEGAAADENEKESDGDSQTSVRLEGMKKPTSAKKPQRSKKGD